MNGERDFKIEMEKQQKLDAIMTKLSVNTDDQIKEFAGTCVNQRYPLPAYRDRRPGEQERQHAQFVATRLKLVWAMRQYATLNLPHDDPYSRYLRG